MKHIKLFEGNEKSKYRDKLIDAITFGNEKDFNLLLNKHFYKDKSFGNLYSINFKNDDGWTPLTAAVHNNRKEMVNKLLDFGADINYKDNAGQTPLMIAAEENLLEMLQILIESGADWNIKNNFSNFDFFDLLYNEDEEIIIEDYPEKYKDYLMKKDAKKYNL